MSKTLFALPFFGLALIAAAPAPQGAPAAPALPIVAPADIAANLANRLTLELSNGGQVVVQLRPDAAPLMVQRVQSLVQSGFYNGLPFHRVIPGFMAQGGDPKGDGTGGSPLPDLKAEFNGLPHLRGTMAAARAEDPNSANSQFYIMFAPRVSLDGKYTVFGRVVSGMQFVDSIAVGEPPAEPTRIVRATLGGPVAVAAPVPAATPVQAAEPAPATN
ncbi:peptidylprolyl isomerase [Sphingomonas sp. GCM10030256]|uniref:peptidylprolyl isomerase n=1 Tax=Sphingomonas sp. GCM10030256 TaxID=3273427 RepID=UPI0036098E0C